jgi:hypothetical protein
VRLAVSLFAFTSLAFAQAGISGIVSDAAGLPVPNAAVTAEEQSTRAHFREISGSRGEYRLLGLPPGAYLLAIEKTAFRSYRRSGITLRAGDQRVLDIQLEVGGPRAEAVEVRGDAPLLETST